MNNLEQIIYNCRDLLNNYYDAENYRDYLNSRISYEMQEKFQFGYFPHYRESSLLNIPESLLKANKLLYEFTIQDSQGFTDNSSFFFENHPLIMPYKNVYGEVVAIVGRTLLSDSDRSELKISKYKNTPFNKGSHVFGLFESKQSILDRDEVYIVEGQFDVIKCHENNINNVVAIGSSNLSFEQFAIICRYTNNINIMFDNDEAGNKGADVSIKKYNKYANIKKISLPCGYKDIDEYLLDNNRDFSFI